MHIFFKKRLFQTNLKSFCDYSSKIYWEKRYKQKKGTFEWYSHFDHIKKIIKKYAPDNNSKVLNVGAGNSTLSMEMYKEGYENIINIDYSSIVIKKMIRLLGNKYPKMTYLEMDVTDMKFNDLEFDIVIDKGTFDALLCGEKSIQVKMLDEIYRVLKYNGIYLCVSHGNPETRVNNFIENLTWNIKTYKVSKYYVSEDNTDYCYLYRMIKK